MCNLSKSYADVTVLRDVSFNSNPGDRVGLIGLQWSHLHPPLRPARQQCL